MAYTTPLQKKIEKQTRQLRSPLSGVLAGVVEARV
jgi:hypothetical protein